MANSREKQPQQGPASSDNPSPKWSKKFSWPFWPVVPIYPYGQRRTLCKEVVKGKIWTFDQLQGILYVIVPTRMTLVKLSTGGFLVYAPVAPTEECLQLVQELVECHGDIKYIILPTASGIEHKVFAGPFARCFPSAQVFVAPGQWSFPLNLPLSWLGLPAKQTQVLPQDPAQVTFSDELDYAILGPIKQGPGSFSEIACFHRQSRTLLVTDTILSVPEDPPEILQLDPYPLLFHAKDDGFDVVEDSPGARRKGWQRIALFAFFFRPSALEVLGWGQTFRDAVKAPDRSKRAFFGLFPAKWQPSWKQSFDALWGGGRLFVAPILQKLVLNRGAEAVIDWANQVAQWNFQRIIPCHFDSPLKATPDEFRQAFTFLEKEPAVKKDWLGRSRFGNQPLPESDFAFLDQLNQVLTDRGITMPPDDRI